MNHGRQTTPLKDLSPLRKMYYNTIIKTDRKKCHPWGAEE